MHVVRGDIHRPPVPPSLMNFGVRLVVRLGSTVDKESVVNGWTLMPHTHHRRGTCGAEEGLGVGGGKSQKSSPHLDELFLLSCLPEDSVT